ncbi:RTX toxin [Salinibacterium sp. M195]|uniref:RTX toxin n=1 Tax=Salinibacterium sp. M195 TaxID=2583374 RepID=UPI0021052530|nr:RTX toxin [Salinibacterium sp. M195]
MRDIRGISAVVALALVAGSGLAVVSVSSAAEAHTPSISVTCEGVTVKGLYYEQSGSGAGQQNLIKYQLAGGEQQVIPFSKNGEHFFAFPNSTEAHTFTASVTAWNNPTHSSWNREWTKTSSPCAVQSIVSVTATSCDVPGGSTGVTATFKGLVADRKYELTLSGGSAGNKTVTYTPTQTTGSYTWDNVVAGGNYKVTITDTTNRKLTACKSVQSLVCPELSGIAIVANECTVPGEGASIKISVSDLVIGREYRISVVNAGSDAVVDSHTFTATATTGAYNSPATPSASYYATVVDTSESNATPLKTGNYTFLPCPEEIVDLSVMATQCDVVSTDAPGTITVAVEGLVPGRSYNVVIVDKAGKSVLTNNGFVATTDRFDAKVADLAEGTYTATVTDALQPSFTASASATIVPCATNDTTIELAAEQCTVLDGDASITATVSNFAVGRDYTVTLMLDNVAVGTEQTLNSSTSDAQKFTFDGLTPDNTYRVVVTDTKSNPTITAAADMYLAPCPDNPEVGGVQAVCNVLGATGVTLYIDELVVGQSYTVTIVTKSSGAAVDGVLPVTFVADMPTRDLTIDKVPNGDTYIVTVMNEDQSLASQIDVTLEVCDLPTFPLPPEEPPVTVPPIDLPTLAFTGSSTTAPTLAGLGFLQLGLVLVGFSVARRRSVVRKG